VNLQQILIALQEYWADQGCIIYQPYDTEMGAGTMAPATFLKALGPEPWNTAYVQPCRRPTDGRYGENPNRLGAYYQFQVILKPDPGNSQELYLGSLEALGIDTRKHDVRFVEDNWESPVLGEWHPCGEIQCNIYCISPHWVLHEQAPVCGPCTQPGGAPLREGTHLM